MASASVATGKYGRCGTSMTLASVGTVTRPDPNGQMPATARNSVDLPAPEGPVTSTRSPALSTTLLGIEQRLAVGQADGEMIDGDLATAVARQDLDDRRRQRRGAAGLDRALEAGQPRHHRLILGDLLDMW